MSAIIRTRKPDHSRRAAMKCICCEGHVHLVFGEISQGMKLGAISWPLYTQYELKVMLDSVLNSCSTEEKKILRKFRTVTMRWAKRLKCVEGKRLKGERNLPESSGVVAGESRMNNWWEFVEGKSPMCNFTLYSSLGVFVYPLYDCKFVKYHTEPSRTLQRFKDPDWKGEFQIPVDL